MLAIDTNVLVRFLVDDDHEQFVRAQRLIERGPVYIADTVLLESEWVLRNGYGFDAPTFVEAIRAVAGLPAVALESPRRIAAALEWRARGMDFADALHLAAASACDAFLTFDRRFASAAARIGAGTVRAP